MKNKIFQKKNFPFLLLIPMLLFLGLLYFSVNKDSKAFHTITASLIKEELSENTLNLHYTFANPANFGLKNYTVDLPLYSYEKTCKDYETLEKYCSKLEKIQENKLTSQDKRTHALLLSTLQNNLAAKPFLYFDDPLSPSSGMQNEIPILLAEYTFRTKKDVEDYLKLLDRIDDYFESLLVFESEKKEAGLLQPDSTLEKVQMQCLSLISKEELKNGSHFLQTTFTERLVNLKKEGLLCDEEVQAYIERNNRLLLCVVLPAYENLADGLLALENGDESTPTGLCHRASGKEYYEWLVQKSTGSFHTVPELKAKIYADFGQSYKDLSNALTNTPNAAILWQYSLLTDAFPLPDPNEMLADLQERMCHDFPSMPGENAAFTLKEVSENLSPYCAPAFYLTPPMDDTDTNVIYINKTEEKSALELYTTLAHEGYPGHLYQSVYTNRLMTNQNANPANALLSYPGFQEGYALYVEFLSYDYAADLACEKGMPDLSYGISVEKCNRRMQLCLLAFLDLAIHYDGASLEDVTKVLSTLGITNPAAIKDVYCYICEEPANYLKYYVGFLEIENLKEEAMRLWGNSYSTLKFHRFLLDNGPADFSYLKEKLCDFYIDSI